MREFTEMAIWNPFIEQKMAELEPEVAGSKKSEM